MKADRRCQELARLAYMVLDGKASVAEYAVAKNRLEACGIIIEGQNKWKTLIQNASKKTASQ